MHRSGGDSNDVDGIIDVVGVSTNEDYDDICGDGNSNVACRDDLGSDEVLMIVVLTQILVSIK